MIQKFEDIEDNLDVDEKLNCSTIQKLKKINTLKNKGFIYST